VEKRRQGLCAYHRWGYAEYAVADAGSVLPVPDGIDLIDAAGLAEATFTAWTNVVDTGRLQSGESLLIHGGTSGIGSLAIQIFAARGHYISPRRQ